MKALNIILFLLSCSFIFCDDGTWGVNFDITNGSIYSEVENPDIRMKKEIIKLKDIFTGSTEVIFLFENTTNKNIEMYAGFPINITIPTALEEIEVEGAAKKAYYLPGPGKYGGISVADYIPYFETVTIIYEEDPFNPETDYLLEEDLQKRIVLESANSIDKDFDFSIYQNNKLVDIDQTVIESKFFNEQSQLTLTYHFKHKLTFKPKEQSIVKVEYSVSTIKGTSQSSKGFIEIYNWNYILWTGRTWKDNIEDCCFVTPNYIDENGVNSSLAYLGEKSDYKVFYKKNYEPAGADVINVAFDKDLRGFSEYGDDAYESYYNYLWFDYPEYIEKPAIPAQDFVIVKGASSNLKEKCDVYTENGIIKDADYSALSLFDGVRETAWCENKKDDGVGEWIEFELLVDVNEITIQNGFNKSFQKISNKDIDTYYEKNNRVKVLEFVSKDEKIKKTITLKDKKELQNFEEILPKGIYKIVIKEVYKGTKWSDTCLGELTFKAVIPEIETLLKDNFFRDNL